MIYIFMMIVTAQVVAEWGLFSQLPPYPNVYIILKFVYKFQV